MADSDLIIEAPEPPSPEPRIGDVFGKWRVVSFFEWEGETWAKIQNTRNASVHNREPVSALPSLKGDV